MACYDKEWVWHCENHPNINHLDISSFGQWLRDTHETIHRKYRRSYPLLFFRSYYVVKTKRRVVFTSITISKKLLLNIVDIWLIMSSIPVGKKIVMKLPVKGLLNIMSIKRPILPYLSTSQNCIFLKKYFPMSDLPVHTREACSLFQPICQLLIQYLDPPVAMCGRPYISA